MNKEQLRDYVREWLRDRAGPLHRVRTTQAIVGELDAYDQFYDVERALIDEAFERGIQLFTE